MRVVSPFRPFPAESVEHRTLGPFDWISALGMLGTSVQRACRCETVAITDVDTDLPVPSYRYATQERRLMLWILEVSLRYIESDDFNTDTVMVCPDLLVYRDLSPYFRADLGLMVRGDKFVHRPIINSVQWWRVEAKQRLAGFMAHALDIARSLPEELIVWGADSEPLRQLIEPIRPDAVETRLGLTVAMLPCEQIVHELSSGERVQLETGRPIKPPPLAVTDFKYRRKQMMRAYFDATLGGAV